MNVKSTAIPADWKPLFDEFHKHMGYRFELRRIEYPAEVHPASEAMIRMWWVNAGVAPVYRPYTLALRIRGAAEAVVELPVDIRKWLPGDSLFEEPIAIPDLPAGKYRLEAALLARRTHQPAIALAIAGRREDGWYDLGEIAVAPKR